MTWKGGRSYAADSTGLLLCCHDHNMTECATVHRSFIPCYWTKSHPAALHFAVRSSSLEMAVPPLLAQSTAFST